MVYKYIKSVRNVFGLFSCLLLTACATYAPQFAGDNGLPVPEAEKTVSHTFYLIGDAGKSPMGQMNPVLKAFKKQLSEADPKKSTALFLGDNIYPAGLPGKSKDGYAQAKHNLDAQLRATDGYKGQVVFIPGNHDWYAKGLKGLERQQKYIEDHYDSKDVFQPRKGCPIEKINISDDVVVIAIDTEWFVTDWNQHPTINDDCEIRSRAAFFDEIKSLLKKNAAKTTILAMHHPMSSYGPHGGQFSARQHLYPTGGSVPLPIIGSLINVLRRTTGAASVDVNHPRYRELRKRIYTLAQQSEKVILVSGHEHSLQYIVEANIPQIISGAGAKKSATKKLNGAQFTYGNHGYAVLQVFSDGSSRVDFHALDSAEKDQLVYSTEVYPPNKKNDAEVHENFPDYYMASIYRQDEIEKSGTHSFLWGDRYRDVYGIKVNAPTVRLDTLFGGLTPVRKGGGNQSKSLRLENPEGKQYVMRALRKGAEQYIQAVAFKDQYVVGDFQGTTTEDLLEDFYTGSHPYAPFVIGPLADAIGVYHTNPVLYFIPKQEVLGRFNHDFGDELYMIEEHAGDDHDDQASFGHSKKLISTDDLIEELRKDDDILLDNKAYIRARLFDMVLGDWDRHKDQWRWARIKDKKAGKVIYRPVPRDRDQAFSVMGDGLLMQIATRITPALKSMEGFQEEIRNVKGFNTAAYAMDMVLLSETTEAQWQAEAEYIKSHLTVAAINEAFESFPEEVRGETIHQIKRKLRARTEYLPQTAAAYYHILNKYSVVAGTDKDDWFEIERLVDGHTKVQVHRIKNGKKGETFFSKTYNPKLTKELWVYGLDDDDYFETKGEKTGRTRIRLIGGLNNDVYDINGQNRVIVYDHISKVNTFKNMDGGRMRLTNDYNTNTYQPQKFKNSTNLVVPVMGFNPDDGFLLGASWTNTFNGFRRNPFTERHKFSAAYAFATNGFNLGYEGEFAHIMERWNLGFEAKFTSPFYTQNFFGFGNETENLEDDLGVDYYRTRLESFRMSPSLIYRGQLGSKFALGLAYETIEVEFNEDRIIPLFINPADDMRRSFLGLETEYNYKNKDNRVFPTMGMEAELKAGYKTSVDDIAGSFGYIVPSLAFDYRIVPSGQWVLATKFKGHFNIGDGYEFYQAASIGANDGPRGFRNQRFTGRSSFYQKTDLRWNLKKVQTTLIPISVGFFGGFDYGRVWQPGEDSNSWHQSYGGGFFINGSELIGARFSVFGGEEGARVAFGLGFNF